MVVSSQKPWSGNTIILDSSNVIFQISKFILNVFKIIKKKMALVSPTLFILCFIFIEFNFMDLWIIFLGSSKVMHAKIKSN